MHFGEKIKMNRRLSDEYCKYHHLNSYVMESTIKRCEKFIILQKMRF